MSSHDSALEASLREAGFRGDLRAECPLGPYTTWRIGGPAELLARPADREDLQLAVGWAVDRGIEWRVMGNGSNLLVRDEGVRGLVLRVRRTLDRTRVVENRIEAEAGASLPAVARLAATQGLAGLEFGAGIPGTIGGAVVMNAGWHRYEIGNHVTEVIHLDERGAVRTIPGTDCAFAYRDSRFRHERGVLLRATFALERGEAAEIQERLLSFAASRKANQPTDSPSCGSVFLKPPGDFAGRLIDEAGLKGLRVGDIEVSRKHANFFVNVGHATAREVLELVRRVEAEVERRFGVELEREFEIWP
jgi:UDP-N-acetylmuramate dehydrogenase